MYKPIKGKIEEVIRKPRCLFNQIFRLASECYLDGSPMQVQSSVAQPELHQ